jgi:hypothetical protein
MVLDGSNIVGQAEGYAVWPKNFQAFQAIVDAFDVVPKDSRQPPLKSKNLQREWLPQPNRHLGLGDTIRFKYAPKIVQLPSCRCYRKIVKCRCYNFRRYGTTVH